jgi:phospholipid-binding lipoprotein MlaA
MMRHPTRRHDCRLPTLLLAAMVAGCATPPPASDPDSVAEFRENNDPIEPFNRRMFAVNDYLDRKVVRPVAVGYQRVIPAPVRTGIRNVLGNLRSPVIFVNDILQGNAQRAADTFGRFFVNTTLGLGGIIDVAARYPKPGGVPAHTEDFGQTFATWGIGEGPYLFVPLLGPSNPRDLTGYGLGTLMSPTAYVAGGTALRIIGSARAGLSTVDTRESLIEPIDILNGTLDPYASYRSAYRQRRKAEIANRLDRAAPAAATGTGFGTATGLGPAP